MRDYPGGEQTFKIWEKKSNWEPYSYRRTTLFGGNYFFDFWYKKRLGRDQYIEYLNKVEYKLTEGELLIGNDSNVNECFEVWEKANSN